MGCSDTTIGSGTILRRGRTARVHGDQAQSRRMHCGEMLALVLTGLLAMWSGRMLNWWAPIAGIVVGTHLIAAMRKTTAWLKNPQPGNPTGLWTVVNMGLVWIFFAFTSFGVHVIHGRVPDAQKMVSTETPLATVAFLDSTENLPAGFHLCLQNGRAMS